LGEGETKEEIVASLVDRFGEGVLGAPVNRGFGRLAWLGPIVIVLIGLGMIWAFLRKYLSRETSQEEAPARAPSVDPKVRARIEEELRGHRT
jgi:cytochrome c-type biogenesis protein CcmH/NrfF